MVRMGDVHFFSRIHPLDDDKSPFPQRYYERTNIVGKRQIWIREKEMVVSDQKVRAIYEIQVQGELDQSWEAYFNDLAITSTYNAESPITTLTAPVVDQPALRGLLCKLWDLNLTLIAIRRLGTDKEKEDENGR